jgi:hypothetical protein
MNPDPTTWKFPVLAALSAPFHIQGIRELTEEEQVNTSEYTKIAADARNRFKLFTILTKNYQEWNTYTQSLFTRQEGLTGDEMTELDGYNSISYHPQNPVRLQSSGGARDGDAITRAVVLPQTLLICGHDDRPESEDGHPESN